MRIDVVQVEALKISGMLEQTNNWNQVKRMHIPTTLSRTA